jgi:hypothetical protein
LTKPKKLFIIQAALFKNRSVKMNQAFHQIVQHQKKMVELDENLPLSEIKKIISKKFPNTNLMKIKVYSGFPEKDNVLRFAPYNFSSFIEHEDSFESKIYYPHSLGFAIEVSKTKDPELKKTKIFFFQGELCLTIQK